MNQLHRRPRKAALLTYTVAYPSRVGRRLGAVLLMAIYPSKFPVMHTSEEARLADLPASVLQVARTKAHWHGKVAEARAGEDSMGRLGRHLFLVLAFVLSKVFRDSLHSKQDLVYLVTSLAMMDSADQGVRGLPASDEAADAGDFHTEGHHSIHLTYEAAGGLRNVEAEIVAVVEASVAVVVAQEMLALREVGWGLPLSFVCSSFPLLFLMPQLPFS